jgi:hypothetical protein
MKNKQIVMQVVCSLRFLKIRSSLIPISPLPNSAVVVPLLWPILRLTGRIGIGDVHSVHIHHKVELGAVGWFLIN